MTINPKITNFGNQKLSCAVLVVYDVLKACESGNMSKVLIVEDNELNAKLFRDLLEAHGHETVTTRDGMEAIDIARNDMPDLILMDIQLPEISGLDVTRQLKADPGLKRIPVIAVTAFAMKDDEQKILQAGCEGYISKPISIVPFMETIDSFLNSHGANVVKLNKKKPPADSSNLEVS